MTVPAIRVAIVEDQPLIRKDIERLVANQPGFIVVGGCGSIREAIPFLRASDPDIVLLDIALSDGTGFDLLQHLEPYRFKVLFVTAYQDHAIKAIKFGALDYLIKPVDQRELSTALRKALQRANTDGVQLEIAREILREKDDGVRMALRTQEGLEIVKTDEIMYVKSDGGYCTFYLANGQKIITSKYLKEYDGILPANLFLRPHQSYAVNILFIRKYHKDGFLRLRNNEEIPVSLRRRDEVIQFLTGKI